MKVPDDNDLLQASIPPWDPTEDAEPYEPPPNPTDGPGEEWASPIPLRAVPEPPAFPVEMLPRWLGDWVRSEAEALQCPVDLPAVLGLAVLSLGSAKRAEVQIKGDWIEPLNLYFVVALPSGESKSPAFRAALAPVQAWETEQRQKLRPVLVAERAEREAQEARREHLKKKAARARNSEEREADLAEAKQIAEQLSERKWTVAPQLVLTDVTAEKLVMLLQDQGGRIGILSDEGGPFDQMAGRYQDGPPNLDIYLQAYSRGTVVVERVGRAPARVEDAALTFGLAVQPEVIQELSNQPGFRGRGLLARFQYSLPPSRVGSRDPDPPPVAEEAKRAYETGIRRLLDWSPSVQPLVLKLSSEGRRALTTLKRELEPRIGPGGDLQHLADWVNKLAGTVVRLAGLLHLAEEVAGGSAEPRLEIDAGVTERAVRLGRYFLEHARAAFDLMAEDAVVGEARRMLSWIRRRGEAVFSQAEAYRGLRASFSTPAAMDPALELLQGHHWIRRRELPARKGAGRKPSPVWEVHPQVLAAEGPGAPGSGGGSLVGDFVHKVHFVPGGPLRNSSMEEEKCSGRTPPSEVELGGEQGGMLG